tara:strand:- start:141 stop:482 length:342 start_codon:yes stop_codon:yes gene_type:complete
MNIEPLKEILDISEDKKNTILFFINDKNLSQKLKNYEFQHKHYLNQNIILIKKNNLNSEIEGKIIYNKINKIGIKLKNNLIIYINPNHYYIFTKFTNKINNNKQFYKTLLNYL